MGAFEELAGHQGSAMDAQTARELATSSVPAEVIVAEMRRRARVKPGNRPASLRYFRAMVEDLEKSAAVAVPDRPVVYGYCDGCANAGLVADRSGLTVTYHRCPDCGGNPPLDRIDPGPSTEQMEERRLAAAERLRKLVAVS